MYQTQLWNDITTAVRHALDERLDLLSDARLVQHSDALLATMPSLSGSQPTTTAGLLRRYDTSLHQAVCWDKQPRLTSATVADELRDLTRAVILTLGSTEGVSIDAAVALALVLYARGIAPFCALPVKTA
jgi:hypothetical protein